MPAWNARKSLKPLLGLGYRSSRMKIQIRGGETGTDIYIESERAHLSTDQASGLSK